MKVNYKKCSVIALTRLKKQVGAIKLILGLRNISLPLHFKNYAYVKYWKRINQGNSILN